MGWCGDNVLGKLSCKIFCLFCFMIMIAGLPLLSGSWNWERLCQPLLSFSSPCLICLMAASALRWFKAEVNTMSITWDSNQTWYHLIRMKTQWCRQSCMSENRNIPKLLLGCIALEPGIVFLQEFAFWISWSGHKSCSCFGVSNQERNWQCWAPSEISQASCLNL